MVHGLGLRDGRADWYRNRLLRSPTTSATLGEPPITNTLAPDRPVFAANTNVIGHAGRTFALVEGGACPVELSRDLDTVAYSDFDGTLPLAFSAHPKRDPVTGALHTLTYHWKWGNQVQYLRVNSDCQVDRVVDIPTTGGPMIHDVAFTQKYIIIMDLPCVFDMDAAPRGVSLPYRWKDDYPARLGLLPREGGAADVVWRDIDPCFIFHPLNAYDDEHGRVVFDACVHPKMFASTTNGPGEGKPRLERWILYPDSGAALHDVIDDRPHEFPRHNETLEGLPGRYGYTSNLDYGGPSTNLVKVDLKSGMCIEHVTPNRQHLEGVFVPRENADAEDDGWVMAYAWDSDTNAGSVVIVDAQDFTAPPVTTIALPQRVPYGFHGNWIPD